MAKKKKIVKKSKSRKSPAKKKAPKRRLKMPGKPAPKKPEITGEEVTNPIPTKNTPVPDIDLTEGKLELSMSIVDKRGNVLRSVRLAAKLNENDASQDAIGEYAAGLWNRLAPDFPWRKESRPLQGKGSFDVDIDTYVDPRAHEKASAEDRPV